MASTATLAEITRIIRGVRTGHLSIAAAQTELATVAGQIDDDLPHAHELRQALRKAAQEIELVRLSMDEGDAMCAVDRIVGDLEMQMQPGEDDARE